MADAITIKALQDASLDAKSLEDVVNGDEAKQVTTRLGETYPSVKKAIKELFENGGLPATPFKTKVLMTASALVDGDYAQVTDDTVNNGLYVKSAGAWVKSDYDPISKSISTAKSETTKQLNKRVYIDDAKPNLDASVDKTGNVYRYTDANGGLHLTGLKESGSVQSVINNLDKKLVDRLDNSAPLTVFTDKTDAIYSHYDSSGNLHIKERLFVGGVDVAEQMSNGGSDYGYQHAIHQSIILNNQSAINNFMSVDDYYTDNLIKRMPAAIKTDYGLLVFYHYQVAGYNGDSTGSELWKGIVDIDASYVATTRSTELFQKANADIGIIKHPMLGRDINNRIVLLFERVENWVLDNTYNRYISFSADEGVTFTDPVAVDVTGIPSGMTGLGTTGAMLLLESGRIVCPAYHDDGRVFSIISDDNGASWFVGNMSESGIGHEPSITYGLDGSLVMDTRPLPSSGGNRYKLASWDDGDTWNKIVGAQILKSGNNQGSLLADKKLGVYLQTRTENLTHKARDDFSLSLSYNNLKSFDYTYRPFAKERYVGYSQIIKLDEGIFAIIAEMGVNPSDSYSQQGTQLLILSLKEVLNNVSYN